jgi:abequosyltransferase
VKLSYIRQPQNLGADGNIGFLLQHATGDFMLMLSDDDILLPGAIDRVFETLAAQPALDAIGLNARIFLNSLDEPATPVRAIEQDQLITNRDEVLTALGTWITFLSALAFRRSASSAQGYSHRVGTNFIHAYVFLDVLARDGGCWLTSQPFLAIRGSNTGGYDFFQAFVSDFAALLEHAVRLGFSPRATRAVLKAHEAFILGFVIAFKLRGVFGALRPDYRDGLLRIWRVYCADPIFLLKITPLLLVPQFAAMAARRVRHLFG